MHKFSWTSLLGCYLVLLSTGVLAQTSASQSASAGGAASSSSDTSLEEIVVTAQKREQGVNSVPMSISAFSGTTLYDRGIVDTADLVRVVPGFTYTESAGLLPIYTLRGVGLYDAGIGSAPAVSVYVDEMPLPFSIMTTGASLDLERVEVLKGPQGTLFGESSTGGAINYIAAKPTANFGEGGSVTLNNFGRTDITGYVTGSLSDTLTARLAVRAVEGGAWQYSISRPNDKLGNANLLVGRLTLDWHPSEKLHAILTLNGNDDRGDTQAPQLEATCYGCNPTSPNTPLINAQPIAPHNPRAANWWSEWPMDKDNPFWQPALRVDYSLSDHVTLTSLTEYADQKVSNYYSEDGTAIPIFQNHLFGDVKSVYQEFRAAGTVNQLHWLVGINYENDKTDDNNDFYVPNYSHNIIFPTIPAYVDAVSSVQNTTNTYAAFTDLNYSLTNNLSVDAGVRVTQTDQNAVNCSKDGPLDNGQLGQVFEALQQIYIDAGLKTNPVVPIPQGDCYTLNAEFNPGPVNQTLDNTNVPFRFAVDYKFDDGILTYASFSRGYKAGVITDISASTTSQYFPAREERLDAWEVGIKAPLFERKVQFNSAAFYYDYQDKQVLGRVIDPIWGANSRLVNIPKSRVVGGEADITARPISSLKLSASATYLDSKVTSSFINFDAQGLQGQFEGSQLPYTPKWEAAGDAEYDWKVGANRMAFIGAGLTYHSQDNATFSVNATPNPGYNLPSYTLLDLRAGFGAADESWQVMVWGHNVTDRWYITSVYETSETRFRYTGLPATYGISVQFHR
jgi:iron complex outermembrane recepter protein